ncbi:unnamed protein product [Lasius platythorax]|uniref:Uncharacterized protein n=1 Tax=Lasius platythorax TaxID=488582 RepID=A0AAV2MYZ5_9HYME
MKEKRGMKQKRSCGWKRISAGMIEEILEQEKREMVAAEEGSAAGAWKREEWSVRRRGTEVIACTGR